jgi:hypothetical protein
MSKYLVQRKSDNKYIGIGKGKWVVDKEKAFIFNTKPQASWEERIITIELIIQ